MALLIKAGSRAFRDEEHGVARDLLIEAESLLLSESDFSRSTGQMRDVRTMLAMACVSDDYERGAICGEWLYNEILASGPLRYLAWWRRWLPDPWAFILMLFALAPYFLFRYGFGFMRSIQKDVVELIMVTGYMCNCLAANSKLTSSRQAAQRLQAFVLKRKSVAQGMMTIAETIACYHQEPFKMDAAFAVARAGFEVDPRFREVDPYSQILVEGVTYYVETISDAWQQHSRFHESSDRLRTFAETNQNAFLLSLLYQSVVEYYLFFGQIEEADRAEEAFFGSLERLGGKARQREWLVRFAMGMLDIDAGRFEQAKRRQLLLQREAPGYFTHGYSALLEARLRWEWKQIDRALESASEALRWAEDPEVQAVLFRFRIHSLLADVHLKLEAWSEALPYVEAMEHYGSLPIHRTSYFRVEAALRRAALSGADHLGEGIEVIRNAVSVCSDNESVKQRASCHQQLALLLHLESSGCVAARDRLNEANQLYRKLGNLFCVQTIETLGC